MKVREIMYARIYLVESSATVAEAVQLMDKNKIGSVLVRIDGKLAGIMSERDVLGRLVAKEKDPATTLVQDIMSTPLITIKAEADVQTAADLLVEHGIKRLVVVDNDEIVGIISARGIAKNVRYLSAAQHLDSFDPQGHMTP